MIKTKKNNREIRMFKKTIQNAYSAYKTYGCRSNKKTKIIHEYIKDHINKSSCGLYAKTEVKVSCSNHSGTKRHDIVVYTKKNNKMMAIIPVKFIMSNFKQNKNNYLENLVGECYLTKQSNPGIKIIPINIIFNQMPYFTKNKKIKKIERFDPSIIDTYKKICHQDIFDDSIFYIINHDPVSKSIIKNNTFINEFTSLNKILI